jgi:hypothetical protein
VMVACGEISCGEISAGGSFAAAGGWGAGSTRSLSGTSVSDVARTNWTNGFCMQFAATTYMHARRTVTAGEGVMAVGLPAVVSPVGLAIVPGSFGATALSDP